MIIASEKTEKILIFSVVVWVLGVIAFCWVIADQKKEFHRMQEQEKLFNTKLDKLEELFATETNIQSLSKAIGETIREENPDKERQNLERENRELVFTTSMVLMVVGATVFAGLLLLWVVHFIAAGLLNIVEFFGKVFARYKLSKDAASEGPGDGKNLKTIKSNKKVRHRSKFDPVADWKAQLTAFDPTTGYYCPADKAEKINLPLCDKKTLKLKHKKDIAHDGLEIDSKFLDQLKQDISETILSGYRENAMKVEDSLKAQTENMEKKMSEFNQANQKVREESVNYSEPINTNIEELTQQISAIREYASTQQDRITKLQDGYDWNITRTFCLRIIRSIDNIEGRIISATEMGLDIDGLEEIRDDFLFALESSSVEQFEPEINSEYAGNEMLAEVVKEKQAHEDPGMSGRIAKVLRPGYRYVIDDQTSKVVRPARVMLYEEAVEIKV